MDPSAQRFKVLAVDDSAIYRKLVQQSILGQEYEVLFAQNGREALDLFAAHLPAVVITD
jgi:CheY-like chemotaxis protein